ncbi:MULTISPECIES: threonine synthase [Rhodomicrobium]|uniref:threonine synthase n=1 Tax=Rhodomicrobium TaxID=1068 RepID=UPI000B4B55FF|nr:MULTISPECIES: threonine synthase [Rhodomicrobium]
MNYISTRGQAQTLDFEAVLMAGLARDGGLYVPNSWPSVTPPQIAGLAGLSYPRAAAGLMQPLVADAIPADEFAALVTAAYRDFAHAATVPLVQLGDNLWLQELFHGPTLAFKDLAMQLLGRLMDRSLKRSGQRVTILAATSGDTGAAAVEAFKNRDAIDLFVLFPDGRVSDAQRRQMTTSGAPNVHPVAVKGTFDDCQGIVKALFGDLAFRDAVQLSAVNSINWARIMAQTVYYFTAAAALGSPHRSMRFCVPTGNFGDIFAGYAARAMGLPVARLVIATNSNDILARTLATGRYEPRGVVATASPSMDIQVSSNFERLIFEASGRDPERVRALMAEFAETGAFALAAGELAHMRAIFSAHRADEAETAQTMRRVHAETGYLADPHTAVALAAAAKEPQDASAPMIVLSTAHPAKFPEAVERATGRIPAIPERLQRALSGREDFITADAKTDAVGRLIRERARTPLKGA